VVAHTRKTPGAGPLRPINPRGKTPEPVNQSAQSLQFRPLNLPVPIEVAEDRAERPVSVALPPTISNRSAGFRWPTQESRSPTLAALAVTSINDIWQVDDEWWRERPISRRYYQITTQSDSRLTVFQDDLNGNWYWQKEG